MELSTAVAIDDVKAIVIETLGIEDRADALEATTSLDSFPELDSMAILELLHELEERFGIEIDGDDVTADVFETLASLTAFVNAKHS